MLRKHVATALGVLALAALVFVVADWATSVPSLRPCTQQEKDEHGDASKKECPTLSSRILQGRAPVAYEVGDWLEDHNGAVTALAGLAVAAFTGVLWYATEKLWSEARAQRRDARRAAFANLVAARAARKSAEVAEKALTTIEIAYVYPIIRYAEHGTAPLVSIAIRNYGRTPAIIHRLSLTVAVWRGNTPDGGDILRVERAFMADGMIGAGEESDRYSFSPAGLGAHMREIQTGAETLGVNVSTEISDVVGTRTTRMSWFIWHAQQGKFAAGLQRWT